MEDLETIEELRRLRAEEGIEDDDELTLPPAAPKGTIAFKNPSVQKEFASVKPKLKNDIERLPFQDQVATSGARSEQENRSVGGVPNSKHLTGDAVDLRKTKKSAEVQAYLKSLGYKVLDEGDHLHTEDVGGKAYEPDPLTVASLKALRKEEGIDDDAASPSDPNSDHLKMLKELRKEEGIEDPAASASGQLLGNSIRNKPNVDPGIKSGKDIGSDFNKQANPPRYFSGQLVSDNPEGDFSKAPTPGLLGTTYNPDQMESFRKPEVALSPILDEFLAKRGLDKPESTLGKVGLGGARGLTKFVEGLETPENIAYALFPGPKGSAAAAFGPQMVSGAYTEGKKAYKDLKSGNYAEGTEAAVQSLLSAYLTKHLATSLGKEISNAPNEGSIPKSDLAEHQGITPRQDVLPDIEQIRQGEGQQTGGGNSPGRGEEVQAAKTSVRPLEPVYLGSGLGGLQDMFEKDPVVAARKKAVADIEAHADRTGKKMSEAMDDFDAPFDADLYADVMTRQQELAAKNDKTGPIEAAKDFYKDAKRKLIDFNAPIEDLIASSQKKFKYDILPKHDYTNQVDRVLRSPTLAGQFVKDAGLDTVIRDVDSLPNLDQYMIAKQARTVEANGIKTGRNLARDQALIDAYGPKYEAAAKQVTDYSRKLLDYATDSGLISKETAQTLKEKYPDYAPLNRIFKEIDEKGSFSPQSIASLGKQTVVQKLKGSDREIASPVHSLLEKTNDAFVQGERNKAGRTLAGMKDLPGFEGLITELPKGETAKHTFSFLDNGEKRTFETSPEIAAAAKALNVQQLNIIGKIFAAPVRLAKTGITGLNLPFTASNLIRDQFTAFVNSGNPMATLPFSKSFFKGLAEAIKHGDLYDELVREGAGGTSFDIARNAAPLTVERIRAGKDLTSRVKYTVRHPSELLRAVENIISRGEEATRLQQYGGTKKALLKKGRTPEDASLLAAKAARENTANFARRGEWGTVINSMFLYLNASKEGSRAFLRGAKRNPLQTAIKVGAAVMLPQITATMWNLKDPERRKAYEDIYPYAKDNSILIIPPNPTKDENGQWNVIRIPMEPGVGKLGIPARRLVEQSFGLDPVKATEFAQAAFNAFSPIDADLNSAASALTPQAIKPGIEAVTNTNLFTGKKQVPARLEKLSPENQVRDNTSGTARKIAGPLGVSPIKVEEFIKGTLGGIGSQGLNAADTALAGLGVIPKNQVGGQSIPSGITARFTKAPGGKEEQDVFTSLKKYQTEAADKGVARNESIDQLINNKLLSKDKKLQLLRDGMAQDPDFLDKIKDQLEEKKLGIGSTDKAIKSLSIKDGSRARFLADQMRQKATPEERQAYIIDLVKKGLVNKEVLSQIISLKQQNEAKL